MEHVNELNEEILAKNGFEKIKCIYIDDYFWRLDVKFEDIENKEVHLWSIDVDKYDNYFIVDGEYYANGELYGQISHFRVQEINELQDLLSILKLDKKIII